MKPPKNYYFLPLSTILFSILTTPSCMRPDRGEIKINDFPTLKAEFFQPSREYTSSPFFVWNGEITTDEIDEFMVGFKNAGCSQVFVHPRPGLITEYLSDKWFENFRFTVQRGKELGMDVWIYDENSYPSGFAGGHVPADMPESYNQGQGLRMIKSEILPDTADLFFLILKEEDGVYKDITSVVRNELGKQGNYFLFSKSYFGKSDWYGGFPYVDLIYPGVTQKFIEITMSGYEKYTGEELGKAIPGVFTDEPHINTPGGIRWTPDLFDVFLKSWGYDLKLYLPLLFEDTGDYKRIRHNYTQTLLQLFIDRWAKPWYQYCEEKGLKFTGHYWEHEWPNMRHGGDNMAMYAWHHMPGIDMLFNQWNDSSVRAQFGNIRSVKELASAANQTGRQRKLSETYGGSGWDLTFTQMKRNCDWQYALGVNFLNQHLTYFTLAGARKYDYPPSFDYHQPWWEYYRYINDHYARLSLALSSGRQINDILVLEPTTTAWLYDSYAVRNPKVTETGQAFQSFITRLEKSQAEYDLGSENILKDLGSVRGSKLEVGQCSYSRVVIPPLTENLDIKTYQLLRKFASQGGDIVAFSVPTLIDGARSEELMAFFNENQGRITFAEELSEEFISKNLGTTDIEFSDVKGGTLYHHRRVLDDGQIVFLVNSDLEKDLTGFFAVKGKSVIEMNTLTGEILGYPSVNHGNKLEINFSLPPAGTLLLFIPASGHAEYEIPARPQSFSPVSSASPLMVKMDRENVLTIDFCDIQIGNKQAKDLNTYYATDMAYRYHGFRNGNPWNSSVQYRTRIIDRDTFDIGTGFAVSYHFEVKGVTDFSSFRAVVERPWLWRVKINGRETDSNEGEWWLDRSFGVFDISKHVRTGQNTINLSVSPMRIHAEIEPVYILGLFSVEPAPKGWVITPLRDSYTTGNWREQGLPFYSWGATYSKEFKIDDPAGVYEVGLGQWNGTVSEVIVNGQKAGVIAFPPYRRDVTSLIKPGINRIEVAVIGSLKNLLGPHHNNPAPGFVSPGTWRNVKSYPPGIEYQLIDYGLMDEFVLYNGI